MRQRINIRSSLPENDEMFELKKNADPSLPRLPGYLSQELESGFPRARLRVDLDHQEKHLHAPVRENRSQRNEEVRLAQIGCHFNINIL